MTDFNNAKDLIEHYAKLKKKLWGPMPVRPQPVRIRALPVSPVKEPEPVKHEAPVKKKKVKAIKILTKTLLDPKPKSVAVVPMPVPTERIFVPEPRLTFKEILTVVMEITHLRRDELFARRRYKAITDARHLLWALSRDLLTHLSLPQIAAASGLWDHTTVLHGARRGVLNPDYPRAYAYLLETLEQRKRAAEATLDNDVNEKTVESAH